MSPWLTWLRWVRRGGCSICGLPRFVGGDHTSCLMYQLESIRRDELGRHTHPTEGES